MSWVYVQTEPGLWAVGHYDPSGEWHTDTDHAAKESAAARCHFLNGGRDRSAGSDYELWGPVRGEAIPARGGAGRRPGETR